MSNPYLDEARSTRATKMREMGVGGYPDARQRARDIAPPVTAAQGDPALELREGKMLTGGPENWVKQLNTPEEERAIPVRAGLPDGKFYGHQEK